MVVIELLYTNLFDPEPVSIQSEWRWQLELSSF